ncbi:VOC family protein [Pseudohaliea sp.]|uniref:VOC family protein n=1 Tax=Pseudohaliea sp. TaxID=2740289 RepID=UPI0032EDB2E3
MDFEVDHIIIVVKDLNQASADYEALGFTLTAKSIHPFGTANRLIWLGGSFIELLAIEDPERLGAFAVIKDVLDRSGKDTPWGLVWSMQDPRATHEYCESIGMAPSALQEHVTREIQHPDGSVHETCYSSFALVKSFSAHYMEGFSVQHRPDSTFAKAWKTHGNGGGVMKQVVLESPSLSQAAEHFDAFGHGLLKERASSLEFGKGKCRVQIVPQLNAAEAEPGPTLSAVEIAMADLAQFKRAVSAKVDFTETSSGTLDVAAEFAAGVRLRLTDGGVQ